MHPSASFLSSFSLFSENPLSSCRVSATQPNSRKKPRKENGPPAEKWQVPSLVHHTNSPQHLLACPLIRCQATKLSTVRLFEAVCAITGDRFPMHRTRARYFTCFISILSLLISSIFIKAYLSHIPFYLRPQPDLIPCRSLHTKPHDVLRIRDMHLRCCPGVKTPAIHPLFK